MQSTRTKTILFIILFIFISLFLIYWQIPYGMFSSGQKIGTTILSSFIFFLSAPCFYLIFRILFGKFLGILFSLAYVLYGELVMSRERGRQSLG